MIWTKRTHQSAKFQTFNCSSEISPSLYFHRLLLLKVYKISAKKSIEDLCLITRKKDAKFEENWFVVSKMTRIWWILIWALEILKIFTLIGSFCARYITFYLEKYRGVIFHYTEEWCKFEEKLTCGLENDMRKILIRALEVSKLGLWWDPLIQSRKCMSLKFTEELCVITMKNDEKFTMNWLVVSKLTWGICQILTRLLESLKNLHFNGLLSNKA